MPRLGSTKPRLAALSPVLRKSAGGAGFERRSNGPNNTARWQRLRLKILQRDGWRCQVTGVLLIEGRDAPNSAVVDHIVPHRGDLRLFWDEGNLQAVAKSWHDRAKQSQEKRGLA